MQKSPKITRGAVFGTLTEIVVNFALPYAIFAYYQASLGDVKALIASSIPPIVWSIVELIRKRRVDAISLMVIAGIVLGLLAFVGGGSVKFLQLRENLVTGFIGLVFLGSAIIKRPIIYEFAKAGQKRQSAEKAAAFEQLQSNVHFRRSMILMTVVWGIGMLAITAVSCILVFALTIRTYLVVSPIVGNVGFGALALWSFLYVRSRQRLAKKRAQST